VVPEPIKERPFLLPGLQYYYDVWSELRKGVAPGFSGPGAITNQDIFSYADALEVIDRLRFHRLVRAADEAYLIEWGKKNSKTSEEKGKGTKSTKNKAR